MVVRALRPELFGLRCLERTRESEDRLVILSPMLVDPRDSLSKFKTAWVEK